jgi:hypothetical protein
MINAEHSFLQFLDFITKAVVCLFIINTPFSKGQCHCEEQAKRGRSNPVQWAQGIINPMLVPI